MSVRARKDVVPRIDQTIISLCAVLFAVTVLTLYPVTRADFISFDDPDYITSNPIVQRGFTFEGLKWAFTTGHSSNWHPLTWLTHMADCQLYELRPAGHHVTNLVLHASNAVLLLLLMRLMTGTKWRSAMVAALFALHPLHVESVAWVAERKDVLSTFFGLLACISYVRYALAGPAASNRRRWYALTLSCFVLGLMSKPMLVTLPFILLLLDLWPLNRWRPLSNYNAAATLRRLVMEKIPLFALAAASCVVTLIVQDHGGAVRSVEEFPLWHRIANSVAAYGTYLQKTVYPVDLAIFYPHTTPLPTAQVVFSGFLLATFSALALLLIRTQPFLFVGWFWFLGMLVPVIGIVQVGEQAWADRYSYLPLTGTSILLVWGASELFSRMKWPRWTAGGLGGAVAIACATLSHAQARVWLNNESLFEHAINAVPRNYLAHNHLATELLRQDKPGAAKEHLILAVRYRPGFADARVNLGSILAQEGHLAEAREHFESALKNYPDFEPAHYNLANLYKTEQNFEEAARHYARVLEINPANAEAHSSLGFIFAQAGEMERAAKHFATAARLNPTNPAARHNLAAALMNQGQLESAANFFQAALELEPGFVAARYQLSLAYMRLGRHELAAQCLAEVLRVEPNHREAAELLEALGSGSSPTTP